MVYKCCVPYCRSGYDETSSSNSSISMHKFPLMEQVWLRAINRSDFTVTKNSRVCSLHFRPSDFKDSSKDQNFSRRKKYQDSLDIILKIQPFHLFFPANPNICLTSIFLRERGVLRQKHAIKKYLIDSKNSKGQ